MGDSKESDCTNFGSYLTNEYAILRNVFDHLTKEELLVCRNVCQAWKDAALLTIKERRKIDCNFVEPGAGGCREEDCGDVVDATIRLTSHSDDSDSPSEQRLIYRCFAEYGVFFKKPDEKFQQVRVLKMRNARSINRVVNLEARFPTWPGVTIRLIRDNCNTQRNEEEMRTFLNIPDGLPIRAVVATLMLNDDDNERMRVLGALKIAITSMRRITSDFALAGCELEHPIRKPPLESLLQLMIFCGSNIDAASTVLDETVRTSKDINDEVEKFSSNIKQTENSVLLMFRCVAREKVKRRYNYRPGDSILELESRAVEKIFPHSSVLGCYGVGEFGTKYPLTESVPDHKKARFTARDFHFSLSTALLHIRYKK